jgi:predicted permease
MIRARAGRSRPARPPFTGLDLPFGDRRLFDRPRGLQVAGMTRHGLAWASGLTLDVRLGARMLVKYPGLTIVGGLAMAFAIWIGAVVFEVVALFLHPAIPLPGGDRIVYLQNWDVSQSIAEPRAVHDFLTWRAELKPVTDLGAWRDAPRNVGTSADDAREAYGAEITASAFKVAPVRPLLGRALTVADERSDAPPVAVLGYDLWQSRFAGSPAIVGQKVRIGERMATVVGIMPKGFAFPVSHELWMPLHLDQLDRSPRAGPAINVFGRLADGATLDEAQAALTVLGRRAARDFPETHEHLQPRVDVFTHLFWDPARQDLTFMSSINLFAIALLALICGNVALLLFARAATRETELIVRSALGASRGRIVMQLFAEALVLGGVAAIVGLGAAAVSLNRWGMHYLEVNLGRMPFWYHVHLSLGTVAYAAVLTLLGAVIAGVLPALKVTRALASKLRQGTAGSGLRFSGVWTGVIVAQVAATVIFPAIVFAVQRESARVQAFDAGFPAGEYLSLLLDFDAPAQSDVHSDSAMNAVHAELGSRVEALRQRVAGEPGVRGVTFADRLPRTGHPERGFQLADSTGMTPTNPVVSLAEVDPSYFDVLGARIQAGRAFHSGDFAPEARTIIVDQGFVDQVLGGRSAIGRRIRIGETRHAPDNGPWYQIVGVVKELGMGSATSRDRAAGVYLPMAPGAHPSVYMIVHAGTDPLALTPRLRTIAGQVDPNLRLNEIMPMDHLLDGALWFLQIWVRISAVLTMIALLLSLAGIYAVLSFTVARRTREIGVRLALGASRRQLVVAIFRRPLTQVSVGILAGAILVAVGVFTAVNHKPDAPLNEMAHGSGFSLEQVALLVGYAGTMMGVCLLACVVPTQRALGIEPTEALRAE